jgi:hypothetical protein
MLAASNEAFLRDVYTQAAIYGGLMGRTFFITPDEFRPANSLLGSDVDFYKKGFEGLVKQLKDISKLKGNMRFENDAILAYQNWYEGLRNSYKTRSDKTGVTGRIHTGAMKIAMILGVNANMDLIVRKDQVEEAINRCIEILPNYDSYVMSSGKATVAEAGSLFLSEMWAAKGHQLSHRDFLAKYWTQVDSDILHKLIETLTQAGMIDVMNSVNGSCNYKMTKKCLDVYKSKGMLNGNG